MASISDQAGAPGPPKAISAPSIKDGSQTKPGSARAGFTPRGENLDSAIGGSGKIVRPSSGKIPNLSGDMGSPS